MNYQLLTDEITNNPKNITDLDWNKTDRWIMYTLNTPGISGELATRESINTADIMTAIFSDVTEFNSLSILEVSRINLLGPIGTIDPSVLQAVFLDMFSDVDRPVTRAALIALATRPASRAEKIPNLGAVAITLIAMNKARRIYNG